MASIMLGSNENAVPFLASNKFPDYKLESTRPRENEGTERATPGPALGICHVHESYF